MSPGERFIASLQLKSRFYDRYERRAYLRTIEVARRIVDDPSTIDHAKRFLDKHVRPDPHQARDYEVWIETLARPAKSIVAALLEDSDRGEELRGTAPVFVVLESGWRERASHHLP